MTFEIRVPSSGDPYNLVTDIATLASDVQTHLTTIDGKIAGTIQVGGIGTMSSIVVSGTGSFGEVLVTGPTGSTGVRASSVYNTTDTFGIRSGSLTFSTNNGTSWKSSGNVEVPNGATGVFAINANTFNTMIASRDTKIATLESGVATLNTNSATKSYVDSADNALRSKLTTVESTANAVTTKANYYQNVNRVSSALRADSAALADNATNALNADKLASRTFHYGILSSVSVPANGTVTKVVTFSKTYTPIVLAQPRYDDGNLSVVCSLGAVTSTSATIIARNLNSTSETVTIQWIAI